jgi:hypothetical protein
MAIPYVVPKKDATDFLRDHQALNNHYSAQEHRGQPL